MSISVTWNWKFMPCEVNKEHAFQSGFIPLKGIVYDGKQAAFGLPIKSLYQQVNPEPSDKNSRMYSKNLIQIRTGR